MGTTPRGYVYPANSDAPNGPAQMQTLATGIDADVSAVELAARQKVYYKAADTGRTSTVALTDDPDLTGMALSVGLWRVQLILFISGAAAADFRHQLTFSGTSSQDFGRMVIGPDAAATTDVRAATVGLQQIAQFGASNVGTDGTRTGFAFEDLFMNVTVAGSLSLQWGQLVSNATATILAAGSRAYVQRCQ